MGCPCMLDLAIVCIWEGSIFLITNLNTKLIELLNITDELFHELFCNGSNMPTPALHTTFLQKSRTFAAFFIK